MVFFLIDWSRKVKLIIDKRMAYIEKMWYFVHLV